MKLYGDSRSGNCYKVMLLASWLDLDYTLVPVDILAGGTRTAEFLNKNPAGKIPLLELDDGRLLCESNAILNYLAEGSEYLPSDPFLRAKVLQWQFFEQYSHEPYIAVARFIAVYLGLPEERRAEYEGRRAGGYRALEVMARHLESNRFFVTDRHTIADVSLYAYTHCAGEGGFDLSRYPAVVEWLERVASHPRHVAMS